MFSAAIPSQVFLPPTTLAASSLLFKSTKLLSPPTHQLYKCSALSRMNLRHTCSRVSPPKPRSPMLFQCSNQSRSQISPPAAPTADPAAQNPQLTTTTRGKGGGGKGKLYQIGVERAAVKAGTSSRRILRW